MRRFPALNTLDVNQNGIGGSLPASWGSGDAFPELLNLVCPSSCCRALFLVTSGSQAAATISSMPTHSQEPWSSVLCPTLQHLH